MWRNKAGFRYTKGVRVTSTGPADESVVRLACVETNDGRAAGRRVLGAVMDSKKLKAIATKGTGKIKIADENRFKELRKEALRRISENEMGVAYAVSNRGACHNRGSPDYVSRGMLSPEMDLDTKTDGFAIEGV